MEPTFVGGTLVLTMNAAKYDGLPADLRALIDETTGPAAVTAFGQRWDAADAHGRDYLAASKVAFNTLAPDELAKLQAVLKPVVSRGGGRVGQGRQARQRDAGRLSRSRCGSSGGSPPPSSCWRCWPWSSWARSRWPTWR